MLSHILRMDQGNAAVTVDMVHPAQPAKQCFLDVQHQKTQITVEQMIKAVSEAAGPGPQEYTATVKKEKPAPN